MQGYYLKIKRTSSKNTKNINHTIFVGDGINDALALTYADASVAVGGLGKDLRWKQLMLF